MATVIINSDLSIRNDNDFIKKLIIDRDASNETAFNNIELEIISLKEKGIEIGLCVKFNT